MDKQKSPLYEAKRHVCQTHVQVIDVVVDDGQSLASLVSAAALPAETDGVELLLEVSAAVEAGLGGGGGFLQTAAPPVAEHLHILIIHRLFRAITTAVLKNRRDVGHHQQS